MTSVPSRRTAADGSDFGAPFAGLIDAVLVPEPALFPFEGAVPRLHAQTVWTWMARDVCPDLHLALGKAADASEIELIVGEMLVRTRQAVAAAETGEAARRLQAQLGSEDAFRSAPVLLRALRHRHLLGKAQAFGRATNAMSDDGALGTALQSMPLTDPALAALLFHVALGQVTQPARLITSIIKLGGGPSESAIVRLGFAPLVDAMLAQAQTQLHVLQPHGAFADIDLTCRGLERFHRLVRAIAGYIELSRHGRWTGIIATLTREASERLEPRLREIPIAINQALRRPREGADRLDADQVLAAMNGVYLLASIRDSRDSLALNALFDQAWSQSQQTLETHLERGLEHFRGAPGDAVAAARLDAGIKMAEVRFGVEYAETFRRARSAAERRA